MDNRDMRLLDQKRPGPLASTADMDEGVGPAGLRPPLYGKEGSVDLDGYRAQQAGSKLKTTLAVPEAHIALLSRHLLDSSVLPVWGLCHGTRHGNEQMWFRQHLGPQARVFGTDISDFATAFPFNIQWDFHEVDPAWIARMDLIYSHAWGRADDLERVLAGWVSCLAPGGVLLLDLGWTDRPGPVLAPDPRGMTERDLCEMLDRICAARGRVTEVIDGGRHANRPIRTIVFRANAGNGA